MEYNGRVEREWGISEPSESVGKSERTMLRSVKVQWTLDEISRLFVGGMSDSGPMSGSAISVFDYR